MIKKASVLIAITLSFVMVLILIMNTAPIHAEANQQQTITTHDGVIIDLSGVRVTFTHTANTINMLAGDSLVWANITNFTINLGSLNTGLTPNSYLEHVWKKDGSATGGGGEFHYKPGMG